MLALILAAVFLGLCLYAALHDVATLLIPNWLNALIAALFVPAAIASGLALETFGIHLAVAGGAFAVSVALFYAGVWGGGDAKMLPAAMLWIGPAGVADFLIWMAYAGGALCVLLLLARRAAPVVAAGEGRIAALEPGAGAPYGVAIAAGAVAAAGSSPVLTQLLKQFSGLH
ncbi:MAG: prepilin peptidase [Pseudomonadota bacterium]